jgi:hypothetical protein
MDMDEHVAWELGNVRGPIQAPRQKPPEYLAIAKIKEDGRKAT